MGGSVGTAALSTVFAGALTGYLRSHPSAPGLRTAATVHDDTVAFYWAAGCFALGLFVAAFVLPGRDRARGLVAEPEPQPLAAEPVAAGLAPAADTRQRLAGARLSAFAVGSCRPYGLKKWVLGRGCSTPSMNVSTCSS